MSHSQKSEPTREMNKELAIAHQERAYRFREAMQNNEAVEFAEIIAREHYLAARIYMGIKEKDQFYA